MTPTSPTSPTTPSGTTPPQAGRPVSLTAGAEVARAMCGIATLGLFLGVFGAAMYRYSHENTGWNMSGPIFGFFEIALAVTMAFSIYGIRVASRTLAEDARSRDQLAGLGLVAAVVSLIVMARLFAADHTVPGLVALVWAVLAVACVAAVSTRAANEWMQSRSPILNVGRWIQGNVVAFVGVGVMLFLYIPNMVVAAMSFNYETGKHTVYQWYSFTWSNWTNVCKPQGMCDSLVTSLWIGVVATLIATVIGTLAAFALVRHRFLGRSSSNIVLFLPMATPEIVMGSSLLALFVALRLGGHLGHTTIIIAHVMFCLSYVVMTVKARLAGMDRTLEQAAMDLYATEVQTFWKVTFPLVFPGILSASLLSFSLSFDDYIVTNLNAGTTTTFPMYVWGAAQRGLPMQVNVVGTFMFLLAIVLVVTADLVGRRRARSA
ncbi:MAG: ABC transporter permease [Nocardioides sp.]|uniref:ABC transporter permease n=1 Tax=Nocardioides sp. TaxID=35761 RepID=UPI0039E6360C